MSALSLAPRALYEEVAELLRQRIFKRELVPGSWIDEMKLAEEYGISRTPLREALKVLTTTFAGTMDVVPLALALTALTGVLPYSAAYFGVRSGVRRWRANDDGGKGHSKAD